MLLTNILQIVVLSWGCWRDQIGQGGVGGQSSWGDQSDQSDKV